MSTKERIVGQWIAKAESDLRSASVLLRVDEPLLENACTLCQQAAEKYLKALLVWQDIEFKRSHSLVYLLGLVKQVADVDPELFDVADFLTPFAVDLRYPGEIEVTHQDATEAFQGSKAIRDFVMCQLKPSYGTEQ
ncbi:MAG: HEPN domain-containing protein [Firmicutes bacterium]|nr:HEPN domain-containing protein [Bacillota bacterium]